MSDYFKGVLIGVLSASLVFVGLHPWTVESQDIAFGNVYSNGVLMGQPSGSLKLITSGTCGTGYSEYTALNGSTLIGTLAANGDVGSTGGSNTITPTGTNGTASFTPAGTVTAPIFTGQSGSVPAEAFTGQSGTVPAEVISWPASVPVFTGSAMATHTHTVTAAGTNAATATTGNTAATNIAAGTGSLTAAKATAPNLTVPAEVFTGSQVTSGATSAGTPAGTVAWPVGVPTNATASFTPAGTNGTVSFTPAGSNSVPIFSGQAGTVPAQVFSGSSFDNRSAFVKVIFCVKS